MKLFPSCKRLAGLVLVMACGWLVPTAPGEPITIHLKNGQTAQSEGLRLASGTVFSRIQTQDGSQGEVGYSIADIAQIEFPEPAPLKLASGLLDAGKADEVVRQLTPLLAYYAPFREIPGSWWSPLALWQVDALTRLGREGEADALLNDLARLAGMPPDLLREVKIKQAAAIGRRGDPHKALAALEPLAHDLTVPPSALSEAWLAIGSAHLALRSYRDALLAFLHVPVYTPERGFLMPPALLGSAGSYAGIDDEPHERAALQELIAKYPDSPEAVEAKPRLQKLAKRTPKPPGS